MSPDEACAASAIGEHLVAPIVARSHDAAMVSTSGRPSRSGEADDHRHDGGHDGASAAVVAEDSDGVAEESSTPSSSRWSH
jgi:hypothetical protein